MKDNKLIAEFMGEKFTDNSGVVQGLNYKLIEKKHGKGNNGFRFHTSWDWLMPVLKKINLHLHPDTYGLWRMINVPTEYTIEEVHAQVVEFIKTYNDGQ